MIGRKFSFRGTKNPKQQAYNIFFDKIGYVFKQPELFKEALTHRSFGFPNNERLEFLGDSVLNCAVSALLYRCFPLLPEGDLTRLRANFVNQQALYILASDLDLGDLILLGDGERKSGGHRRPSILADALEAVIGAIYLESGFHEVEQRVAKLYDSLVQDLDPDTLGKDPKTLLQEYLQGRKMALPEYTVLSTSGDAHSQTFRVECLIARFDIRTIGEGTSRRRAEQEAARQAYERAVIQH
jgi:ribonuclease III